MKRLSLCFFGASHLGHIDFTLSLIFSPDHLIDYTHIALDDADNLG